MSGGDDGTLRLWDLRTCEERATLRAPEGTVRALAISPDGRTVVSGGSGRRLHFWRAASPNEAARAD
jgi:WD40 repeat protein